MNRAQAYLSDVIGWEPSHTVDDDVVAAIVAHVHEVGRWDLRPVLGVEIDGQTIRILDGHHRAAAWRYLRYEDADPLPADAVPARLPAWIIEDADYAQIVDDVFGGCAPGRLSDMDDYIDLPDGACYADSGFRASRDSGL
jgi:hypothetical protein